MDFTVSIPAHHGYAAMIRDLVAHGARHAGAPDHAALAFGRQIEDAVRDMLATAPDESLSVTVRGLEPPIEVVITSPRGTRTLSIDI